MHFVSLQLIEVSLGTSLFIILFILTLDKKNNKEENISIDVSELLSQREDDFKAFEQQKEFMTNLINMLGKITDVVDGKEVTFGQGFSNVLIPRAPKYDEPFERDPLSKVLRWKTHLYCVWKIISVIL